MPRVREVLRLLQPRLRLLAQPEVAVRWHALPRVLDGHRQAGQRRLHLRVAALVELEEAWVWGPVVLSF